jgi:hypothetical protein
MRYTDEEIKKHIIGEDLQITPTGRDGTGFRKSREDIQS